MVTLDWDDPASVNAAFAGVDRLFLLTPFVENPLQLVQTALTASRDAGVRHVVRLSTAGADANSDFVLGRKHGLGEQAVKDSGLGWTILQPTFFMDNFVKLGKPVQYVDLEPAQQRAGLEQQGVPEWMIESFLGLEAIKRAGWASGVSPAVQQVLGRAPESFEAYVDRNLSAFTG